MNIDGTNIIQLTELTESDIIMLKPQWEPTGGKIGFESFAYVDDIYIMNEDGSNLESHAIGLSSYWLDWSPNGREILFISNDGDQKLYKMDVYLKIVMRLSDFWCCNVVSARWSPDATKISYTDGNGTRIINPDGTGETFLYCNDDSIYTYDQVWSPDGTKIAYSPASCGSGLPCGLYITKVDTNECSRVIEMPLSNPKWQPIQN